MHIFIVLFLLISPAAWADEHKPVGTHIQISSSAEQQVRNNEVVIRFRMEAMGSKPAALRKKVNAISQKINTQLAALSGIRERRTINRKMNMRWRYDKTSKKRLRDGWHLLQSEEVVSDPEIAAQLIEQIEAAGAHLDQINYRIERASYQRHRAALEVKAIQQFRQRAAAMARAFDATSYKILTIQTERSRAPMPRRMQRDMMVMESKAMAAAPAAMHGGQQRIEVGISGTILLPDQDFNVAHP